MGAIQSKKDGVVKKYWLNVDTKLPIKNDLLEFTNWSFSDIKQAYDMFCRSNTECPFIDFFLFHKFMPSTTQVSRNIYDSFTNGNNYLNIFQLVCILVLLSHNNYRKKLQLIFVLFDFAHLNRLTNKELILIFQSMVNGFCRVTGQLCPKYEYLEKYCIERFIRVSTLEALQKVVSYRRLIEQVEGNNDSFELFKRFDQQIYTFFTQESYLFRLSQYKKYALQDIQKMYRVIKKANLDKNYQDVELEQKNRRFRLQNRKTKCIKHLLQQKQQKFKQTIGSFKTSIIKSRAISTSALHSIAARRPSNNTISQTTKMNFLASKLNPEYKTQTKRKVLLLNGKLVSKEDVFEVIKYFKSLSGNKSQIKVKQFFKSFEKKSFLKKQISCLFKIFDLNKKGQIDFQTFLRAYYHNITQDQIETIKDWSSEFKILHEADHFDTTEVTRKKEKKGVLQLPKATLKRIDQIFNSIDKEKKGFLVLQDLKQAYTTGFSIRELEVMLKQFGTNNKIYKQGFIKMTLPENWSIEGTSFVGV